MPNVAPERLWIPNAESNEGGKTIFNKLVRKQYLIMDKALFCVITEKHLPFLGIIRRPL